jgi:hypothetical protein
VILAASAVSLSSKTTRLRSAQERIATFKGRHGRWFYSTFTYRLLPLRSSHALTSRSTMPADQPIARSWSIVILR